MTPAPSPAVELTLRVRYPCPELEDFHHEFGIDSLPELVSQQLDATVRDSGELAEFLDEHDVEWSFEIDDDDAFAGGSAREFHGLGEE